MRTVMNEPKHTFRNLPADKRERILQAAVEEFASQGYKKASINSIVKKVGIAKGSLYQYFANKEALFFYIFEQFTILVKRLVKDATAGDDSLDIFRRIGRILEAGTWFIDKYPEYFRIYQKVLFEHDVPGREFLLSRIRLFPAEYFAPLCDEAKKQGVVNSEISTSMVIFLVDAVIDKFLQAYAGSYLDTGLGLADMTRKERAESINEVIGILQKGIGA